ncbi:hypothetical protein LCM20_11885 [Halobacillus litoralis]|nr:hypothetical protein [Halobacillus litoralis]MCA0971297.1 hypothetical protein [Halobacillus litoralis]
MLSLTVLLTFLVMYAADKIVRRFKRFEKEQAQPEHVQPEVEFTQSMK